MPTRNMTARERSPLIARLEEHGQAELTRIYVQQRPQLRRLIASRIHASLQRRLDASDVVQEVYIRASRSLNKYLAAPRIPPLIWLRVLSRRVLDEAVRKQFRDMRDLKREEKYIGNQRVIDVISDFCLSPRSEYEEKERLTLVRQFLSELTEPDQQVIEMRHVEGFSFRLIGEQFEIGAEAAKKRYYRAIDRLVKRAAGLHSEW